MRKITAGATLVALLILTLALTKDRWMPPDWNRDWHDAWLISPRDRADPRETLLADHQKRVDEIESEYRKRIEEEKTNHARLEQRLLALRESNREP